MQCMINHYLWLESSRKEWKMSNEPSLNGFDPSKLRLAEYSALRVEILKRTDIQHQLLSLSIIALGTFVTFGLEDSPTLLLVYPILAAFLSASWSHHDIRIGQIGQFIRDYHEKKFFGKENGWESVHPSSEAGRLVGHRGRLASRGILVGSQILAIALTLIKTGFPAQDILLIALDVLLIVYTAYLLR